MNKFFILGCPRSGATALQQALNRHRQIVIPPETKFFHRFYGRTRRRLIIFYDTHCKNCRRIIAQLNNDYFVQSNFGHRKIALIDISGFGRSDDGDEINSPQVRSGRMVAGRQKWRVSVPLVVFTDFGIIQNVALP